MAAALRYINSMRDQSWQWFTRHAHRPHALVWLAVLAFSDAIFFPIAPEVFLVALVLAQPTHWKRFLPVAIISSMLGAAAGYCIALFLFHTFGAPILQFYGLAHAFTIARHFIRGHVFVAMALASFTPLPDKVFIYAGGFLGVPFLPFIAGYLLGRGIRMALVAYLTGRFGKHILDLINRYLRVVACIILALLLYYGMVHFHLLGL
jgi:membrane protein YqaA with SNARE-associated domain